MTGNIEGDARLPFSAGQLPNCHNRALIGKKHWPKLLRSSSRVKRMFEQTCVRF